MPEVRIIVVLVIHLCVASSSRIVKREVDLEFWSWGLEDDNGTFTRQSNVSLKSSEPILKSSQGWQGPEVNYYEKEGFLNTQHVCAPLSLNLPDFRDSGLRVSEIKCFEYIWNTRYKADKKRLEAECDAWLHGLQIPLSARGAIGGRDTYPGEFPHMAAIGWKGDNGNWIFKCGGSLISSKFVLTAAHCTSTPSAERTNEEDKPSIVRLGAKNLLDKFNDGVEPTDVNILRIIVHPDYKPPKKYHDIALLELQTEILEFTYLIAPACLYGHSNTSVLGRKASLTGWGVIDTARRTTSPELQRADVDLIDSKFCGRLLRKSYNRHWRGFRNQICAGKLEGGVDACQGDSGGPLQVYLDLPHRVNEDFVLPIIDHLVYHQIGVTQFGIGCARKNSPGVYTKVASYIDWIEQIVWPASFV